MASLNVRIDKELKDAMKVQAAKNNQSIKDITVELFKKWLKEQKGVKHGSIAINTK